MKDKQSQIRETADAKKFVQKSLEFWWFAIRINFENKNWKLVRYLERWNDFNKICRNISKREMNARKETKKYWKAIINEHQMLGSIERRVKHESSIKFHFVFNSFIFFAIPFTFISHLTQFLSLLFDSFIRFNYYLLKTLVVINLAAASKSNERPVDEMNFVTLKCAWKMKFQTERVRKGDVFFFFDWTFASHCK